MRWKLPEPRPETPHGAERRREIFALLPHTATDGYTYWLEMLATTEVYSRPFHEWCSTEYRSLRSK